MSTEEPTRNRLQKKELLLIALLACIPLLLFWKIIFLDNNLYAGDIEHRFFNQRNLLYRMGCEGTLYKWNPFVFSGMDCIGDMEYGTFYPLHIIYYFIPTGIAMSAHVTIHFILLAFFTYLYIRSRDIGPHGALFGAIAFTFSSFTIIRMPFMNYIGTYCWFPLLLYLTEKMYRTGSRIHAVYAGCAMAMSFLGGSPQMFYYISIALFIHLLFWCGSSLLRKDLKAAVGFSLRFAIMIAVFIGLSSIQLLTMLQASGNTFRSFGTSYHFASTFSLPLRTMKTMFFPYIFGYPGTEGFHNDVYYFGRITLFLAVIGALALKDRLRYFYVFMFILSFLTALGSNFILFPLFYKVIPFFKYFRGSCNLMFFVHFIVAVCAAAGLDSILRQSGGNRSLVKTVLASFAFLLAFTVFSTVTEGFQAGNSADFFSSIVLLCISWLLLHLYLTGRADRSLFIALSVLLVTADLLSFGLKFVNTQVKPRSDAFRVPEPFSQLPDRKTLFRICTNTDKNIDMNFILANIRFGFSSIQGSDQMASRDYVEYLFYNETRGLPRGEFIDRLSTNSYSFNILNFRSKMIDLLNVKYYFTYDESEKKVRLEENRSFLPRFFPVRNFLVEKDREKILAYLLDGSFEPGKVVFLEESPNADDIERVKKMANEPGPADRDPVRVVEYGPNSITLSTRTEIPEILFCSEIFHPGWKAAVDGAPVKILRANYTFRSILLPPGRHTVTMKYDPASYSIGRAVTLATLLLVAVLTLSSLLAGRKKSSAPILDGSGPSDGGGTGDP